MGQDIEDEDSLLTFAEMLYKCTLCTFSTSILPDKDTFLQHMKLLHLGNAKNLLGCPSCVLKFSNTRDLRNHCISSHTGLSSPEATFGTCKLICKPSPPPRMLSMNTNTSDDTGPNTTRHSSLPQHSKGSELNHEYAMGQEETGASVHHLLMSELMHCQPNEEKMQGLVDPQADRPEVTKVDNSAPNVHVHIRKQTEPRAGKRNLDKREEKQNKSELEKSFGKYASTISIKGNSFYYCQVCMWKTDQEDQFHCHFNGEEHQRTVQKLETPWQEKPSKSQRLERPTENCTREKFSPIKCSLGEKESETLTITLENKDTHTITPASIPSVSDDFVCELAQFSDSESDPVIAQTTGQSNKRKQSMPMAVRRPLDTLDISLDAFSDSILSMDMYPAEFYESLDACVGATEPENVHVKEEPLETTSVKDVSAFKLAAQPGIDLTRTDDNSDAVDNFVSQLVSINQADLTPEQMTKQYPADQEFPTEDLNRLIPLNLKTQTASVSINKKTTAISNDTMQEHGIQKIGGFSALVEILPSFLEVCSPHFNHSLPQRETILQIAGEILRDESVLSWKSDCDKAVKELFPTCKLKRKGAAKSKSTYYQGIKFIKEFEEALSAQTKNYGKKTHRLNKAVIPEKKAKINVSPFGEVSVVQPSGSNQCRPNPDNLNINVQKIKFPAPIEKKSSTVAARNVPDSGIGSVMHLAKFITLYPGPFVTARNVCQKYKISTGHAPHIDTAIEAMTLLQTFELGEFVCLDSGWTKVFFKTIPSKLTEENSSNVNVKRAVYQAIFSERDCKLDAILHGKLKKAYIEKCNNLSEFYPH